MKIRFILWIIFSILLLSGCSNGSDSSKENHLLIFSGESEHWVSEYKLDNSNGGGFIRTITLRYKGSDMEAVGQVEFSFETNLRTTSGRMEYDGEIILVNDGENNSVPSEQDSINVTINWNGVTEMFELTHK